MTTPARAPPKSLLPGRSSPSPPPVWRSAAVASPGEAGMVCSEGARRPCPPLCRVCVRARAPPAESKRRGKVGTDREIPSGDERIQGRIGELRRRLAEIWIGSRVRLVRGEGKFWGPRLRPFFGLIYLQTHKTGEKGGNCVVACCVPVYTARCLSIV